MKFPVLAPSFWLACLLSASSVRAQPQVEISLTAGVAERLPVPVAIRWQPDSGAAAGAEASRWRLGEVTPGAGGTVEPLAVQFEPDGSGSGGGVLWCQLPPAGARERRFRLLRAEGAAPAALQVDADAGRAAYDVREGNLPVLRYNHGTVPVPPGVGTNYARGDYIMPLHGPHGEWLTEDYPKDHPHHRGLGWSWPVTRWKDEVRDIWAVVGVWARPVAMRRVDAGPVFALLEAESVWKWGDTTDIVREVAQIRVFGRGGGGRFIDIELRLTGLVDGVAIGGRPHGGYGGFGLRAQPAEQRVITRFTEAAGAATRRSWLDYSGVFTGGKGPSGLAILEDIRNPLYPSELKEYPDLNYVMPAFPGEREVPLEPGKPLVLRHRVWVHEGLASPAQLEEIWAGYARPPRAAVKP